MRGYVTEGRAWLTELLAADIGARPSIERAKALNSAGILADVQGDSEAAGGYFEASLAVYRAAGDERSMASLLNNLAVLHDAQAEFETARRLNEECLAIRRRVAPPRDVAVSLNNLGLVLVELGELAAARPLLEESLTIKQALDDRRGMAMTLINLGLLAARQDRQREAANCLAESIALLQVLDDRAAGAEALMQLAGVFTALASTRPRRPGPGRRGCPPRAARRADSPGRQRTPRGHRRPTRRHSATKRSTPSGPPAARCRGTRWWPRPCAASRTPWRPERTSPVASALREQLVHRHPPARHRRLGLGHLAAAVDGRNVRLIGSVHRTVSLPTRSTSHTTKVPAAK